MNPANKKPSSRCQESNHGQDDYSDSGQNAVSSASRNLLSRNSHSNCSESANNYHTNLSDKDTTDDDYPGRTRKEKAAVATKKSAAKKPTSKRMSKISLRAKEPKDLAYDPSDSDFSSK